MPADRAVEALPAAARSAYGDLRDYQRDDLELLLEHPRYANWNEAGLGKGLVEGTPVLTPIGWVPVESLRAGDRVIGSDGLPHSVTSATDRGVLPVFVVETSDGCQVICDGDHLWDVSYSPTRPRRTLETRDIATRLSNGTGQGRHYLPLVRPVQFRPRGYLPVDPYVMGVVMGDGCMRKSVSLHLGPDDWIAEEVARRLPGSVLKPHDEGRASSPGANRSWSVTYPGGENELTRSLKVAGVWGLKREHKRVPPEYLVASVQERLDLLRGLMDTDGSLHRDGSVCDFVNKSRHLSECVAELVRSLGGVARLAEKRVKEWTYWRVSFTMQNADLVPFALPRKASRHLPAKRFSRAIRSVTPAGEARTHCIAVDSDDHLFVTKDYLVTHNTRPLLLGAAARGGRALVIASGAIRDTQVWENESRKIGVEPPEVISYHRALKAGFINDYGDGRFSTVILDESQWVKERKVTWAEPILELCKRTEFVYEATGTPMPNGPLEVWGQLRMLRYRERAFQHYWPWVREWFEPAPTRYSAYATSDRLIGCRCPDTVEHDAGCTHWQAFYEANIAGWASRRLRDDVLKDLPPLSGATDPLWCPMTPKQKRAYESVVQDMLAHLPEEDLWYEALTDSHQFGMLRMLSTGLSVLDPAADPKDKESGKLAYVRELLAGRSGPIVVGLWFKNSAAAVIRLCQSLGLSYVACGGSASPKQRLEAVRRFETGTVDVFVGSISVIKEGVDGLQYGSAEAVMLERSYRPGDNEQTIRRIHRLGQTLPCTIRQLVTPGTNDADQWTDIETKQRTTDRALTPVQIATVLRGRRIA